MGVTRIKVEVTVEVDTSAWSQSYCTGTSAKEVREDVRSWARTQLSEHPEGLVTVVSK